MESQPERGKREAVKFKFHKNDISDLYLDLNIPRTLIDDLWEWSKDHEFKNYLKNELRLWAEREKEEKLLIESAKVSVKVIDTLLAKEVPLVVVEVYINFLLYHRQRIEKHLDCAKAEDIYIYIPTTILISFLKLYSIKLSQKEKHTIIKELVQGKDTCKESTLAVLPKLFKEAVYFTDVLIRELQNVRKEGVAGRLMKRLRIPKEQYPDIYQNLLESAAIGLMKRDKDFSWQKLEEVFEIYPKAMASCIRVFVNDRRTSKTDIQGFASICKRKQNIMNLLPKNVAEKLRAVRFQLPNQLINDRFSPSDPKKYFTLNDFDIRQKQVTWVNEKNLQQSLLKLSQQKLIGIDTQSRVARTCLDSSRELLSTIQIATPEQVFIFDVKVLRQAKLKLPEIDLFFKDKEVIIVGHTLSADLNGDVTQLLGFDGKVLCKAVDICPLFRVLYPEDRKASLTYISEKVLGKQICKEYTLTNWDRRPLLRNQLHYAALDAVIVIKIWEKMKEHKDYSRAQKEAEEKRKKKEGKQENQGEQGEQGDQVQERKDEKGEENEEQEQYIEEK